MVNWLKIVLINLCHSCSASRILCKRFTSCDLDIALIQEPWTHRGKILCLSLNGYDTFYNTTCARPRSCLTISSRLKGLLLANSLDRDIVAIRVNYEHQEHKDKFTLMSAYLHFEKKNLLSDKMKALIKFC